MHSVIVNRNVKINRLNFTQNANREVAQQGQDEQYATDNVCAAPVHQEK